MSTDALPLPDLATAARRPGGAEAAGRAVAGGVAEGTRRTRTAGAPHPPAAEADLREHEREVRSAAGRVVRSAGGRGGDCPGPAGAGCPPASEAPPAASSKPKNRDRHGRGRIPDEIERQEEIHDLTDAEKAALGGVENLVELPPETSEQLDWRPSTLLVIVHVRKKYARKEQLPESGLTLAEQNVVVAPKPPEAIPGRPGRSGADGAGDRQQGGRPSALAPAGRDLPAARRPHLTADDGRLVAGDGRVPTAAVHPGDPGGAGLRTCCTPTTPR